jgi:predicted glutamine amidotransferase
MCGIFGSITRANNNLTEQQKINVANIVGGLAIHMQTRGDESTGIATLDGVNYDIFKTTQKASEFVDSKNFIEMMSKFPLVVLGHTRLGTVGEITPQNAHPFRKGNIIGCHNGSVYNWREINAQANVDSEVIFEVINDFGYKKGLTKLRGSFAIVWTDLRNPHAVNLVTHKNPLILAYVKELETYFWASEVEAITSTIASVVGVNKATIFDFSEEDDKVMTIDENLHYRTNMVAFGEYESYADRHANDNNGHTSHTGGYSEDDDIVDGIIYPPKVNYTLDKLDDPFWEKMVNAREEDNFVKRVEAKQCGSCSGEVKIKYDSGFYFDWEIMMPICMDCIRREGINYEDTGEWISKYRYDQLLIEYYVEQRKGKSAN